MMVIGRWRCFCAAVPTEHGASLVNKAMAKLVLELIATTLRRWGSRSSAPGDVQRLSGYWEVLAFQPDEHVEHFALRADGTQQRHRPHGGARGREIPLLHAEEVRADRQFD